MRTVNKNRTGLCQGSSLPNRDHRDILNAFTEEGVKYLVVEACALAAHGIPRATVGLDLHIYSTEENAARV